MLDHTNVCRCINYGCKLKESVFSLCTLMSYIPIATWQFSVCSKPLVRRPCLWLRKILAVFLSFNHAIHLRRANIHTGQNIFTWKDIFITLNCFILSIFICPWWPCIISPSCDCSLALLLEQAASTAAYASAVLQWMQGVLAEYSYSSYLQSPPCMVDFITHSINSTSRGLVPS